MTMRSSHPLFLIYRRRRCGTAIAVRGECRPAVRRPPMAAVRRLLATPGLPVAKLGERFVTPVTHCPGWAKVV